MRLLLHLMAIAVLASGCTTKARSKAEARAAYEAGQRQALSGLLDARRVNIRFIGPVHNPEVVWTEGLTLIPAIAAAGYNDARDPNVIVIIRQRQRIEVSPLQLNDVKAFPLEPGDTIEIHP